MVIEECVYEWFLDSTFCFIELWEHIVLVGSGKPFEAREPPLKELRLRRQKLYQMQIQRNNAYQEEAAGRLASFPTLTFETVV